MEEEDKNEPKNYAKYITVLLLIVLIIQLLFSKIDSLEVGKDLKERGKIKHYEISTSNAGIFITQYLGSSSVSFSLYLTLKEYEDRKQAFIKFEAE